VERQTTYSESVEDVATSVKSEFFARVTVRLDPADLHVARSDHFKLIVPSQQHVNQYQPHMFQILPTIDPLLPTGLHSRTPYCSAFCFSFFRYLLLVKYMHFISQ